MKIRKFFPISLLYSALYFAQDAPKDTLNGNWSVHFQSTVIGQQHSGFNALYSGPKSLNNSVEPIATSLTATLFIGRKLWKNAAVFVNPEVSGGKGLSFAQGVAGALNGETYRVGAVEPQVFIARAYIQQEFPLKNSAKTAQDDEPNQISGDTFSDKIVLRAGKFAIADFYDDNAYAKDPRTQFMNWAMWANGAWDYPANTRGYTFGAVAEIIKPAWEARISTVAVPKIANFHEMEYNAKAHSETVEFTYKPKIKNRSGNYTLLISNTLERSPSYREAISALQSGNTFLLDVMQGSAMNTSFGGKKLMIGINGSQEITDDLGIFSRLGWNDGKYASWAFTEIDNDFQLGISLKGNRWNRNSDVWGLGFVTNGISSGHREFLEAGGTGFILGDGALDYRRENILETYYSAKLTKFWFLTADYQFVTNPGYNHSRGPVHVFGLRCHIEL